MAAFNKLAEFKLQLIVSFPPDCFVIRDWVAFLKMRTERERSLSAKLNN